MIHMKYQGLFSTKNKKKLLSAVVVIGALRVKWLCGGHKT